VSVSFYSGPKYGGRRLLCNSEEGGHHRYAEVQQIMKGLITGGHRLRPILTGALMLLPNALAASDLEQTASVQFREMPWGRYAELTLEFLPSTEAAIAAYQDPAKRAELA
jgi:hypothetical protein